eukprot:9307524-Pyramimonas_sp.AAC.1
MQKHVLGELARHAPRYENQQRACVELCWERWLRRTGEGGRAEGGRAEPCSRRAPRGAKTLQSSGTSAPRGCAIKSGRPSHS